MSTDEHDLQLTLRRIAILSWRLLDREERRRIGVLAVGMVINSALQTFSLALLIPFIGLMLDPQAVQQSERLVPVRAFLGDPTYETLLVVCSIALLIAFVLKNVFDLLYNWYLNRLIARVESRVSTDLLRRCMDAPYEWFLRRNTSHLMNSVMAYVTSWARAGLKSLLTLIGSAILLASVLTLLVTVNPIFGFALACTGAILAAIMLGIVKPHIWRLSRQKQMGNDDSVKTLLHALNGFKDIRINSRGSFFVDQYSESHHRFTRRNAQLATLQPVPNYTIEIAIATMLVAVGIFVAFNAELRTNVISVLAIYGVAIIRMVPVFNQVSGAVNAVHSAVSSIENVTGIEAELAAFAHPAPEPGASTSAQMFQGWQRLTFDHVGYGYPETDLAAVKDVSFTIETGMRIGVVGPSGAGKTTMIDILTGLLAPTSGRVTIDDVTLTAANAPYWHRQLGYVPQHPFMADETLRFNVALEAAMSAHDDTRILEALETAQLRRFVETELPDSLDTYLGDHGVRLSGGQRQRVAIARALFRDPSFLVFDEATSSLDAESEHAISRALRDIPRHKTILIIAHRLSTVRTCDRILVLENGKVVDFDTHDNLMQNCALYRHFIELGDISSTTAAPAADETVALV